MYIVVTITTVARSDQIIWAHMLQCASLEPSLWSDTVQGTSRSRMVPSSSSQWTDSHKLQLSQHWRQWLRRSANIHIGIARWIPGHAWCQETVTCRDLSIAESVVRRITFNAQRITKEPKISWRIMRKRFTVEITMPCAGYTLPEINT